MSGFDNRLLMPQRLVAQAFGVTSAAVSQWAIEPRETMGRTKLYYLPDVISYRISGAGEDLDLQRETARLKKAQADKTELEVEVLRKTLIPAGDVQAVWEGFISNCRARLLSVPEAAAPRVSGETVPRIAAIIREMVYEALEELRQYEPDDYATADRDDGDASGSAGDKPAAKANRKPVGRRKPNPKPRGERGARKVAD